MKFTKEELNALGVMVANAPIKGSDGRFVADLLDKIQAMMQQEDKPECSEQQSPS